MKNQLKKLQEAVDNYHFLSQNQTLELIDEANLCFEILNEEFNWNVDQEGNERHMEFFLRATDNESASYLKEVVIPEIVAGCCEVEYVRSNEVNDIFMVTYPNGDSGHVKYPRTMEMKKPNIIHSMVEKYLNVNL